MRPIAEFAFIALILVSASFAQTNISSCQAISTNGSYILNQSITQVSGDCLPITASNVILDCNGSSITGLAGANNGISLTSVSNVTVQNCLVSNYSKGIKLSSSNNNNLTNNSVYNNSQQGFVLSSSSNNNLTRNLAYNNPTGFYIYSSSSNNNLSSNSAYNNSYGFDIESNSNILNNDSAYTNSQQGFFLYASAYNNLTNNLAYNNSNGFWLETSSNNNILTNNTAYNNTNGFYLKTTSNNNILTSNTVYNNSQDGFYFWTSSNNNLTSNSAYNNSYHGFLFDTDSNNNTLTSNSAYNNSNHGFFFSAANNNTLTSNIACNNSDRGFILATSSNNNLTSNLACNNTHSGFEFSTGSNNTITNNTAYSDLYGFDLYLSSNNNTLTNNLAYNNTFGFTLFTTSNNNTLINNTAYNNSISGFLLQTSCNNNNLTNNSAYNNSQYGFYLTSSSNNSFTGNSASNNSQYGFYLDISSSSNTLTSNSASYSIEGIFLNTTSNDNTLTNNSAYNNSQYGFYLFTSSNNSLANNSAYGNRFGFYIYSSSYNNLTSNTAYNNSYTGFYLSASSNNSLANNSAYINSEYGFWLETSSNITLTRNTAYNNSYSGFFIYSNNSIFTSNSAYNNSRHGIYLRFSSNNTLTNNSAYNNTQYGLYVRDSNLTNATNTHLFNNTLSEFYVDTTGGKPEILYLTNMTIDGPLGDFTNYTSLSITDTVEASTAYLIKWTSNSSALPANHPSFAQKFVNISSITGTVSIDSITWNWLNSELTGYDASHFELWKYNSSWTMLNSTPDTSANTLSLTNMNPASDYGILDFANVSTLKLDQTAFQPSPGGIVQFNITITNNGNVTLTSVIIYDVLPDGLDFSSATSPYTQTGQVINWTNASMASGTSMFLYLNATVNASAVNSTSRIVNLTNYMNATGVAPDATTVTAENYANATVYYANESVVKLNLTAQVASQGGIIQYQINVTNTGNVSLNITVNDTLDSMLTYNSTDTTPVTVNGNNVNWSITDLAPGFSQIILLNASVTTTPMGCQDTTNNVSIVGMPPNGDPVTANTSLTVPVCLANVSAVKVDITPFPPSPGGLVQWSINISNPGQVALEPVFVTDTLPDGFEYAGALPAPTGISPDNMTMNWTNVGPVAAGDSVIILLNSTVGPAVANGTYFNNVTVIGTPPNGNDVSASDSAQVGVFAPAINILKTVNPSSALVGRNVTYTINISNTGSANLTVTVVDVLPFHVLFKGSDVPPTSYVGQIITWENITNLTPGSSFAINYNVSANATGVYSNNATATGVPPNGNNVSDSDSAAFSATPLQNPPSGGGSEDKPMTLTDSFACPGNEVIFSATSGSTPLPGVTIRVIYDDPPAFYVAGDLTTDSSGHANITLSSSGTYRIYAKRSGYRNVDADFDYTACPVQPECLSGQDCPAEQQCVDQKCSPVQCLCGQVADHSCLEYQCCSDSDCQIGQTCENNTCKQEFQCTKNADCSDTQYCDIPEGAGGGPCKDVSGCGAVANHTIVMPYDCGAANCPACPENYACEDFQCISYGLTGLQSGFVGDNITLHATKGNASCQYCDILIVLPDGSTITGKTDADGNLNLQLLEAGNYGISLVPGGALIKLTVKVVPKPGAGPVSGETTPPKASLDLFLPLLVLLLLVIAALIIYWKTRKKK